MARDWKSVLLREVVPGYSLYLASKATYQWLQEIDKIVLLRGTCDTDKNTLLCMLSEEYKSTNKNHTDKNKPIEVKINGIKYGFYNTTNATHARKELENFRKDIQDKMKKDKKPVLEIFIFNIAKYDEKNNGITEKDRIQAYKFEAESRGFKTLVIGTHTNGLSLERQNEIEDEIKNTIGLSVIILELENNSKAKIEEIIEASV